MVYLNIVQSIQVTFSRYFLLDAISLACPIRISAYVRHHAPLLGFNSLIVESYKSPQQLDCRENWIYAYRIEQFSQNDHPSSMGCCTLHGNLTILNRISETKVSLADWAFHNHLTKILTIKQVCVLNSQLRRSNCHSRCHIHAKR